MKSKKWLCLLLALLLCIWPLSGVSAAAQKQNLTLALTADTPTLRYGETVKISVSIAENPGILGANFAVKWDTDVLELVSTENSADFNKIETNYQEQFSRVVVTVGDPMLGVMRPDLAEKYTGTGKAVTLTFRVKDGADADTAKVYIAEGASYVDLTGYALEDVVSNTAKIAIQNLTLALAADTPTLRYGETVKISVSIAENPGILGANFAVKWDTDVLELVSAEKGADFNKIETNYQEQFSRVVVTVGDPMLGVMLPDRAEKYDGTGKAVTLTFRVKDSAADTAKVYIAEGASYVDLTGYALEDVVSNTITFDVFGAEHQHTPGAAATCVTSQVCTVCSVVLAPATGVCDYSKDPSTCQCCGHVRADVQITDVILRPNCSGLYFKGSFAFDQDLQVARSGIAVSLYNQRPVADDSDRRSLYTIGYNSVLVSDILGGDGSGGETKIYARAYALLEDGTYIYGKTVVITLRSLVEIVDTELFDLLATKHKTALADMYRQYADVMQDWLIPKIKESA